MKPPPSFVTPQPFKNWLYICALKATIWKHTRNFSFLFSTKALTLGGETSRREGEKINALSWFCNLHSVAHVNKQFLQFLCSLAKSFVTFTRIKNFSPIYLFQILSITYLILSVQCHFVEEHSRNSRGSRHWWCEISWKGRLSLTRKWDCTLLWRSTGFSCGPQAAGWGRLSAKCCPSLARSERQLGTCCCQSVRRILGTWF